jgi:hypothetical protein
VQDNEVGDNDGGGLEETYDRVKWECSHGGKDGWGCCGGMRDGLEEGGKRGSDCSMNGNGPPSESLAVQPTLKLSKIVELASVPIPKCLLRTKYYNHSSCIPWDVYSSLRLVKPHRSRGGVSYCMTAPCKV